MIESRGIVDSLRANGFVCDPDGNWEKHEGGVGLVLEHRPDGTYFLSVCRDETPVFSTGFACVVKPVSRG